MLPQRLIVITPPSVEPVSLAQAKLWLRVDFDDDDELITELITIARERCEAQINRAFITTAFQIQQDAFPGMLIDPSGPSWSYERNSPGPLLCFVFPRARVLSVTQVQYLATDGTLTTLDPSQYTVQLGDAARMVPIYGSTWPTTQLMPGAVTVNWTAGYGPAADNVPSVVRHAIRMYLTNLYSNRGDDSVEMPQAVKDLLAVEDWGAYG